VTIKKSDQMKSQAAVSKNDASRSSGLDSAPLSVVFLDFDGVIRVTVEKGFFTPDEAEFCQIRMKVLREVAQITGCRYVVSSDWRNMDNREEIEKHLSPYLAEMLHDDWATPICGHRWNEVSAWLLRHPEVNEYAILDDFAQHFEGCPPEMGKRLFLCSNRHGLVPEITARLIQFLTQNEQSHARAQTE
jgi:HAD domain in Swiss Army Knife RNA repair proteins